MKRRSRTSRAAAVLTCLLAAGLVPSAGRTAGSDESMFAGVHPVSEAKYDIAPPDEGGDIEILDGIEGDVYVETYLPKARGDDAPPARYPTVLIMSPYAEHQQMSPSGHVRWVDFFVPRGYAVAIGHVPGTGKSDGCFDWSGPIEIDASARAIEYLGRDATWSNGRVGMIGLSADARTQIAVASLGDPARTSYLRAIVPVEPNTGLYEYLSAGDGVPSAMWSSWNSTGGTA